MCSPLFCPAWEFEEYGHYSYEWRMFSTALCSTAGNCKKNQHVDRLIKPILLHIWFLALEQSPEHFVMGRLWVGVLKGHQCVKTSWPVRADYSAEDTNILLLVLAGVFITHKMQKWETQLLETHTVFCMMVCDIVNQKSWKWIGRACINIFFFQENRKLKACKCNINVWNNFC